MVWKLTVFSWQNVAVSLALYSIRFRFVLYLCFLFLLRQVPRLLFSYRLFFRLTRFCFSRLCMFLLWYCSLPRVLYQIFNPLYIFYLKVPFLITVKLECLYLLVRNITSKSRQTNA